MTDTQELVLIKETLFSMAKAIADVLATSNEDNERIYSAIFKSLTKIETYTEQKEAEEAHRQYKEYAIKEYEKATGRKVETIDSHLNINCEGCDECIQCWDCSYCHNCNNCKNCGHCWDCSGCYDCGHCYDSIHCNDCYLCESCEFCSKCQHCVNCTDITDGNFLQNKEEAQND